MECQDWVEQDMEIRVVDDKLPDDAMWIVDGWTQRFSVAGFHQRVHLINEDTAGMVRDMVLTNRAGWQ
jgi:hypothetical protein